MVLKVGKEVPVSPQSEAKVRVLKVKQAVLKDIRGHKKNRSITFQRLKSSWLQMQPNTFLRVPPGEISLTTVPKSSSPTQPSTEP